MRCDNNCRVLFRRAPTKNLQFKSIVGENHLQKGKLAKSVDSAFDSTPSSLNYIDSNKNSQTLHIQDKRSK